jgi:hypothetical protein
LVEVIRWEYLSLATVDGKPQSQTGFRAESAIPMFFSKRVFKVARDDQVQDMISRVASGKPENVLSRLLLSEYYLNLASIYDIRCATDDKEIS